MALGKPCPLWAPNLHLLKERTQLAGSQGPSAAVSYPFVQSCCSIHIALIRKRKDLGVLKKGHETLPVALVMRS